MTNSKTQKSATLALREARCATVVALHFAELEESGRIERRDSVRASHTLRMVDLYEMYCASHSEHMTKQEYFSGVRKIEKLSLAGATILGYVNVETVPVKKAKAPTIVESTTSGECVDCGMQIRNSGSAASHAKKSEHTVKVQTVLNTTFNPKA